jgi:hypothetical protein
MAQEQIESLRSFLSQGHYLHKAKLSPLQKLEGLWDESRWFCEAEEARPAALGPFPTLEQCTC